MAASKVPREKIPWFPTVNYDACISDRECIDFCKNDVFDWNDALGVPEVNRPYNCVVGCDACAKICPSEAIAFPPLAEFKVTLRKLIAEANREEEQAALTQIGPARGPAAG
jgi:NAD-dependent dihydropyrimidine dehydrogenase PreA subunit